MAKQKSEFLGAFGKAYEIFKAIANAVMDRNKTGQKADDLLSLILSKKGLVDRIADLIIEEASPKKEPSENKSKYLSITVDLDGDPEVFEGWTVISHIKYGKPVLIELKDDHLYVDGKEVKLHLTDKQKQDGQKGHDLRKELEENKDFILLNDNLRKFLYEHPEFYPEHWKVDENGNTKYIYFWGTLRQYSDGSVDVDCVCFIDGKLRRSNDWLDGDWDGRNPAAVLES